MARDVVQIVDGVRTVEGGGFVVRRPFPTRELDFFDPFLLLDEMGPAEYAPGQAKGAPDHPHRGFETVTYMLDGQFVHRDSAGHSGKLMSGDVQWMTAGAGVVHSEMPSEEIMKKGGRLHGFQLWVNLPKKDKMIAPRYQDTASARIPVVRSDDGKVTVKVIAGEAMGQRAVIDTRTPIMYLHYTLEAGARVSQPVPDGFNAFAYIVEGEGRFGGGEDARAARAGQMVIFGEEGEVEIEASSKLSVLLIGGAPLKEPVARYGPFVMNTRAEIVQAVEDFQSGRMGRIG